MDDFIKEPQKATRFYRDESLRAMAVGKKREARYWRLAADAARQVARQNGSNSILVPVRMPFVDSLTKLALSLEKGNETVEGPFHKKKSHWSFEKAISQEVLSHYRYWMLCLIVSSSTYFEQEIAQLLEAVTKYQLIIPKAAHYAQQARLFFETAQGYEQNRSAKYSIEEKLIVGRWVSAAY